MNNKIKEFALNSFITVGDYSHCESVLDAEKFAELIIRECIDSIETYEIPIGNSPAGEMAAEWTYDALKTIIDEIKEKFGIK